MVFLLWLAPVPVVVGTASVALEELRGNAVGHSVANISGQPARSLREFLRETVGNNLSALIPDARGRTGDAVDVFAGRIRRLRRHIFGDERWSVGTYLFTKLKFAGPLLIELIKGSDESCIRTSPVGVVIPNHPPAFGEVVRFTSEVVHGSWIVDDVD